MVVFLNMKEEDLAKLERIGFAHASPKTVFEIARMTGPCTLVLYRSGKLLIQGKKDEVQRTSDFLKQGGYSDFVEADLKHQNIVELTGTVIGTDESLKGDTFGGIVVAGFKADEDVRKKLEKLDVRDSKKMDDREIILTAKLLIDMFPERYAVKNLTPRDYNLFLETSNITSLLNFLHQECYKMLYNEGEKATHVVDKFPGANVGRILETKAESKYIEVAAASVIARYHALEQIKSLELHAGFRIPLGSSDVRKALVMLKKDPHLNPRDFVKLNFSNVRGVFG